MWFARRGLLEAQWQSITEAITRLCGASDGGDRALAIGCAKELAESVAKVVMTVRGEVPSRNEPFKAGIAKAHELLERHPGGSHLSQSPLTRNVVQGAKSI